jgi:small-conductance mechanosensitive channel
MSETEKTNEQLRQENAQLRRNNKQLLAALEKATEHLKQYAEWSKKVTAHYNKLREKISNNR